MKVFERRYNFNKGKRKSYLFCQNGAQNCQELQTYLEGCLPVKNFVQYPPLPDGPYVSPAAASL